MNAPSAANGTECPENTEARALSQRPMRGPKTMAPVNAAAPPVCEHEKMWLKYNTNPEATRSSARLIFFAAELNFLRLLTFID